MTIHRPTSPIVILTAGDPHPSGRPDTDVPYRMLIMGDFSEKKTRQDRTGQRSPTDRRPILVDRDTMQELLGTLEISLQGPLLGDHAPPITLRFTELEDFVPDRCR